jgi:transcription initiation factor TFIID subunit 12
MATNEAAAATTASTPPNPANLITALTTAFKLQSGEAASGARIAQLLEQNMGHLGELMRQGKLTAAQIQQVRLLVNQVRFLYLTGASYL